MQFSSYQMTTFTTTIPENVPSGEVRMPHLYFSTYGLMHSLQYLVRIEQLALHLGTGIPEIFVSCGQISVTSDGSGNPPKVSIPGYVAADDPGVVVDIYNAGGSTYTVNPSTFSTTFRFLLTSSPGPRPFCLDSLDVSAVMTGFLWRFTLSISIVCNLVL